MPTETAALRTPTGFVPQAPWDAAPSGSAAPASAGVAKIDPTSWVAGILGRDHVCLPGFGRDPQLSSARAILSAGVTLVQSDSSPFEVQAALARTARQRRRMRIASLVMSHLGLAAAVAWYTGTLAKPVTQTANSAQSVPWTVSGVSSDGVIVATPGQGAGGHAVAVGQRLPNAEILVEVNPAASTYITNRAVVILRDPRPAQAAPSPAQAAAAGIPAGVKRN